jgi:hypothetical protein
MIEKYSLPIVFQSEVSFVFSIFYRIIGTILAIKIFVYELHGLLRPRMAVKYRRTHFSCRKQ